MRLLHVSTLRLSLFAAALLTLWSVIFYFALIDEVNDEVDDNLEDYAELIIIRYLRGEKLPEASNGSNNQFYLHPVSQAYAESVSHVRYSDQEIFIEEKGETEPARVIAYIYKCEDGNYMEVVVATPTIDRADLRHAIFFWMACLYIILILSIFFVNLWGLKITMRPLQRLLHFLDSYKPGCKQTKLQNPSNIDEFKRLNQAVKQSLQKGEELYEQQKIFIGNASHEMQTPIAICQNRIELLLDEDNNFTKLQMEELIKVKQTLERLSRLNKSLLLLCKIENGQFKEEISQNLGAYIIRLLPDFQTVYASRNLKVNFQEQSPFLCLMDANLPDILLNNLLKNAFVHSQVGGTIQINITSTRLTIANTGNSEPLNSDQIFQRFFHTPGQNTSSGLGLTLAQAVCHKSNLSLLYTFQAPFHTFEITFL